MLNANPSVFAQASQETRLARESEFQKSVRVLLIAPSLRIIGGQSIQASRLQRYLEQEPGIQISFLSVDCRLPSFLRIKYLRTLITLVICLARMFRAIGRADVIHIFTPGYLAFYLAPAPALLAARLVGKPAILNCHDGRAPDHLARWPVAGRLMRLASEIVVPSEYLVEVFARFGLRAVCVPNVAGTESMRYRARLWPRPVFLHTRGLAAEYNPACTLRAFAIIQQRYPEARLTVAHDGPQRRELVELAASLGLRRVNFIGSVAPEDMPALYDSSDIYLMSPDADNMPLSLLECFAAGLPVVSSSAGGISHLIQDQLNGMLFMPGDHCGMAACALRLLEEPGLAARLASEARRSCARYSWSDIGPQWMELYRRLADRFLSERSMNSA